MEQFLFKNAALYQKLLKALPPPPPPSVKEETETNTPDMIVAARIRPLLDEDIEAGFPCAVFPRSNQAGVVDIHDLYNHPRGRPVLKSSNYKVDRLFDSSTTSEQIYISLVASLVPFACTGGLSTLFTYGQTGSGKTYTVSALSHLVSSTLFPSPSLSPSNGRQIHITIIDLAGQSAFDLLSSRKPISLLEDSFGVTQLAGAVEHLVSSKEEMMALIDQATSFRKTETTFKNDASSRSHCICRIRISNSEDGDGNQREGMLYLIDLAGSEAARDIATHGADRMKETREINISLSVLKDCIRGKAQSDLLLAGPGTKGKSKKAPHIPFRQSALTKVLKHVFDPAEYRKCKTVVIACVNPSLADVGATRNTLRFAELLRVLVPKTSIAKGPMGWDNAQLRSWIGGNSGNPPIPPAILAPTESGAELLHLSETEFERRCMEVHGVSREQARAVRAKLWWLHIDSQHVGKGESVASVRSSSRELDPDVAGLGFKERIRSGMVVSWRKGSEGGGEEQGMGVVLCLTEATKHGENDDVKQDSQSDDRRYICAQVTPGAMNGAYEVNLWQQVTVEIGAMEKEVILEYDAGTRYYYISV